MNLRRKPERNSLENQLILSTQIQVPRQVGVNPGRLLVDVPTECAIQNKRAAKATPGGRCYFSIKQKFKQEVLWGKNRPTLTSPSALAGDTWNQILNSYAAKDEVFEAISILDN